MKEKSKTLKKGTYLIGVYNGKKVYYTVKW